MHLFLFINYIGGVSQKKKKNIYIYIGGSSIKKKKLYRRFTSYFCKRNFYNQFKKIIWEKIDWNLWYFYSRDL